MIGQRKRSFFVLLPSFLFAVSIAGCSVDSSIDESTDETADETNDESNDDQSDTVEKDCVIELMPRDGEKQEVSWSSSGETCSWELDGDPKGDIPCSGTAELTLTLGAHTLRLISLSGDPDPVETTCDATTEPG